MYNHCAFSLQQGVSMLGNQLSNSSLRRWISANLVTTQQLPSQGKVTKSGTGFPEDIHVLQSICNISDVSEHVMKELTVCIHQRFPAGEKYLGPHASENYEPAPNTAAGKQPDSAFHPH
jgi:hypothetical protein